MLYLTASNVSDTLSDNENERSNMKIEELKERLQASASTVRQIRQYHNQVIEADKAIDDAGREQIRAAYKCGELLAQEKGSHWNSWGKWCKKHLPDMSTSTIGRYILLFNSSDLTILIKKYRTLNAAYVGEGITSAPRQRITIKPVMPAEAASGAAPTVTRHVVGGSVARRNGDGADGVDLKAKIKGGGNLGDLFKKVSPEARAAIESQLREAANGGQVQRATSQTPGSEQYGINRDDDGMTEAEKIDPSEIGVEEIARLYSSSLLVDALLLQLQQWAEENDAAKIAACALSIRPLVEWHAQHAPNAELTLAG